MVPQRPDPRRPPGPSVRTQPTQLVQSPPTPRASSSPDHAVCTQIGSSACRCRRRAAQQLDCSKLGADQHTPRACAKAVHTLAALLRRRSPAPIRSAYAARIRCSSPATAAMAKSRSRLSRCSFTDYADYDLAGPPPAVLELISIEKCINVSTGTARVMRAGAVLRVRAVEKSFVGQRTRPRASSS